jgi:Sulfotransferase family
LAPKAGSAERPLWEQLEEVDEYRQLCRVRADHLVRVEEPLVFVSQIQRSGGTLLSRLFDGHPEVHAHPYELKIGHKDRWPKLDLDAPDSWFRTLYEEKAAEHLVAGWSKPGLKETDLDVFPFLFLPRLQKQLFDASIAAAPVERRRDVLDSYLTSYFNAWLDNQNLYTGPKRLVTAFTPRTSLDEPSVERFFADYPDGWLVSIVRDPRAWYASAARHRSEYGDLDAALELWRRSALAAIAAQERHGDRVVVLTYEELVEQTERTMRRLADRFGISIAPILLVPTFNGRPVRANSSDPVAGYGVLAERTDAYRQVLDDATIARVDALAGDLYERVRAGAS